MLEGILGRKIGMTQLFDDAGRSVPVTVLQGGPCTVLQVRTEARDGYRAVQLGFDDKKRYQKGKRGGARKSEAGLAKKLSVKGTEVEPKRFVREVYFAGEETPEEGSEVTVGSLEGVARVDVIGTMKGRGTAGTIKRWGHHRGPMTHGSKSKRLQGSTGQHTDPARVFKGRRMSGRYGGVRRTVRNLEVVRMDPAEHLLFVRGGVPGPSGGYVVIRRSVAERSR